jgi:alpha-beta hydrolase superfamily lysophospholipase
MAAALRRTEGSLATADGTTLFRRSWLPDSAERLCAVVHGLGEHSGRYDATASWLAERGCAVHAFDLRGHGRSGGPRAHVQRFADYLDDLDAFLAAARAEHRALPITLLGHSMGGLIALAFLAERSPPLANAVISGPALNARAGARAVVARLLRWLAPQLSLASGIDPSALSRDPEVARRYVEDPLVLKRLTVSLGVELLVASRAVARRGGEIRVPVLLLHGAADLLCAAAESEAFAKTLTAPRSTIRIYPGLRHEIFNEPDREQIYADAWSWLSEGVT